MENQLSPSEQKLRAIMANAPMGLAEIDRKGGIVQLNIRGEAMLRPIMSAHNITDNNLYPVLQIMAPAVLEKIRSFPDEAGPILINELYPFSLPSGGESAERYLNYTASRVLPDCIIVAIDDITEKYLEEHTTQQALLDRSVAQGKFEIASDVLHDIGNAVVGFGSYLTRIRRSLEQSNPDNLKNLAGFFAAQQTVLAGAIGEAKAGAVVSMLNSITEAQKANQEEISKSITEQLNIISHIQEILNIQRQYVNGHELQERKPLNLRGIINDCLSMLFASMDKRAIALSLDVPAELPAVKGDRTRLMQVVLNVLKNSIEAIDMQAAEKTISIRAHIQDDWLVLQVQDSGNGFDEAAGRQLFERGFTTKSSGTGLGLNNCRAIIESHAGMITITSEGPGKGALTTIKLKK
ncbi:MAG TPA: HAMP domain-containing sensor histidine kinase [Puia sp.]|nr:HAMP domain-containing sensor histidine kinase [Puia sp.]